MSKTPRIAEETVPDELDDVSDAQLERAVKILERREAKKLEEDRKAAGLRPRVVVLRYVGSAPSGYPSGACTADAVHVPARIRCDGQHLTISRETKVHPGDLVEQPGGHIADLREYVELMEAQ